MVCPIEMSLNQYDNDVSEQEYIEEKTNEIAQHYFDMLKGGKQVTLKDGDYASVEEDVLPEVENLDELLALYFKDGSPSLFDAIEEKTWEVAREMATKKLKNKGL